MTTEYPLGPDDTHESLAQDLLEQAASPDQVHWSPRPDVFGGGVYVLDDEGIAQRVREVRTARRQEEAERIAAAQQAADQRDSHEDVASGLLTPAGAGFPANVGTDPGSAGAAEANAAAVEAGARPDAPENAMQTTDGADETPNEEAAADEGDETSDKPLTAAQKRAAKKAATKAQADEASDEEKSE